MNTINAAAPCAPPQTLTAASRTAFKKPREETGVYHRPRSSCWWIRYHARGKLIRESARTANFEAAVKLRRRRLADVDDGKTVGPAIARVRFEELRQNLINEYELNRKPKSVKRLKQSFANLATKFANWRAIDITTADIKSYAVQRRKEVKPATVNRELAVLRKSFSLAIEDGQLVIAPHVKTPKVDNAREGFVEAAQFEQLVAALPERYRDPIRFLYVTGWRSGEMKSLLWKNVYHDVIRLPAADSKNGVAREVPIDGALVEIMKRARSSRRLDCPFVFYRRSWNRKLKREVVRPIGDLRKGWKPATIAAGLRGLIIHDLRRSAVRNLIYSGVPDKVAMEITGHKTRAIFDRYHIVRNKEKAAAFRAVEAFYAVEAAAEGAHSGAHSAAR